MASKCLSQFRVVPPPGTPQPKCAINARGTACYFLWISDRSTALMSSSLPLVSHLPQAPAPKSSSPLMAAHEGFCHQLPVGLPASTFSSLSPSPDPSQTHFWQHYFRLKLFPASLHLQEVLGLAFKTTPRCGAPAFLALSPSLFPWPQPPFWPRKSLRCSHRSQVPLNRQRWLRLFLLC